MKLLLVWPYSSSKKVEFLPLSLAYIKTMLENTNHEVSMIDTVLMDLAPGTDEFINAVKEKKPDCVGFSATSDMFYDATQYANQIKEVLPSSKIIIGGAHATSYPIETAKCSCFDYVLTGEVDKIFIDFLNLLENNLNTDSVAGLVVKKNDGSLKVNPVDPIDNLDLIPIPDYEFLDIKSYWEKKGYRHIHDKTDIAPIWISRGCPYNCQFCNSPILSGNVMRYHSSDYVEKWIDYLYKLNVRTFGIVDDNFTFDMNMSKKILSRLVLIKKRLKDIKFLFPNGLRMQRMDKEILEMLKESGFTHVVYAPESGSPKMLKLMQKGLGANAIIPKIREAQYEGLKVITFWVVGYPGETLETLEETRKMILESKSIPSLHMFQPFPGSPIFNQLVREGKISKNYLPGSIAEEGDIDYICEDLTKEEILDFVNSVRQEISHLNNNL